MLKRYGKRDVFLKVDGKPVIFAYGRVINQVPMAQRNHQPNPGYSTVIEIT